MSKTIYIRTSTEDQNPENQLKDIQSMFEGNEYVIFQEQQSAFKNKERPIFENLKEVIKSRQVKDLYVWDLDRIYRNRIKLKAFFQYCKLYGCSIHSFRQDWLESLNKIPEPFNDIMYSLMLDIMGWLAEDESKRKSDRVKIAVRKVKGITKSYKGNKWGRKSISPQKRTRIAIMKGAGHSIRDIAKDVGISTGSVHKYIQEVKWGDVG